MCREWFSAKESDWSLKSKVARIGYRVPFSIVVDEFCEVGGGILKWKSSSKDIGTQTDKIFEKAHEKTVS